MSLPDQSVALELDTIRHQANYTDTRYLQADYPARRNSDHSMPVSDLEAVQDERSLEETADQPVPILSRERVFSNFSNGHPPERSHLSGLE